MTKYLVVVIMLVVLTGCEALKGASNGLGQDVQNVSNPQKNGWDSIQKADQWIRDNLW